MLLLKYLSIILFCLITQQSVGQTLTGQVRDKLTKQILYPVSVINLTTQNITYTNQQGYFSIKAEAGEKIAFSYIGYRAEQYMMPISVGKYTKDIELEAVNYQLQEVILKPDYTPYQRDSINKVKTYRGALTRQKSNPVSSPFSFVAEKFNKRSKQLFKFQKNFVKWEEEKFIDTRYTPMLVHEMTGMTGDSIGYFMAAYPMPYDYARAASELELKMWIRYYHKEWIKHVDTAGLPKVDTTLIKK